MRKKYSIFIVIYLISVFSVFADEGMWIISLIGKNYEDMKKQGLMLTPEDIYNINHSSLKDAVVQFGNGCTGEIVSDKGLLFTNHHCGYSYIQKHSTVYHDYLADGFWAKDLSQELPNPGLTVKFLVRMDDVTAKVLNGVTDDMSYEQRTKIIKQNADKLVKEAEAANKNITAMVKSFFTDNQYFLILYKIYKDVRLVGAPPSSIGKFGGDTDNWMWPRHTGDFSIFRVYADKNNEPAEYSDRNVPYKPAHFLPVSLKGMHKGDFAMIIGYPGHTNRYLSSYGVQQRLNVINPAIIKIRTAKIDILRKRMAESREKARHAQSYENMPTIHIKYATKYAHTSNYWKYFIGQNKAIRRLHVVEKKQDFERKYKEWIDAASGIKAKYGNLFAELKKTYSELDDYYKLRTYIAEAAFRGPDGIKFASKFKKLADALEAKKDVAGIVDELKKETKKYFKDFDLSVETQLFGTLLQLFYDDVDKNYWPTIFEYVERKYDGDMKYFAEDVYKGSIFRSEKAMMKFLAKPSLSKLKSDLLYKTMISMRGCLNKFNMLNQDNLEKLKNLKRLYVAGILEMEKNKLLYPDANLTMRLTYGTVQDYSPSDAVEYAYYTTLKGVVEKSFDDNPDYEVPEKLIELYNKKDYGDYAENGELRVCFLTNNDITGGNSGSPVINAYGELVGLAFDGNWEAMSGDLVFEPELQRTIVVDIRYVLFIIDKFAGAKNLISELKIKK